MEEILTVASGKRRAGGDTLPVKKATKRRAKAPKNPNFVPRSTPARGPNGKFVSGRSFTGFSTEFVDAAGNVRTGTLASGVGISNAARVRNIRKQRAGILAALREAKARRLRDGTIKRLKEASRQLLHRSQLARGL